MEHFRACITHPSLPFYYYYSTVLRKVLVDGSDPMSSLPDLGQIPDIEGLIGQVMAQVGEEGGEMQKTEE